MCGRFVLFSDPEMAEIRKIIEEVQHKSEGVKMGEIFPTEKVPVLIPQENGLVPEAVKWGFPNFRNKGVVINARAETANERPMFKRSLESKRCIIPSCGFYEWSHDGKKIKYQFNLPEDGVLYMAGLYSEFQGERRFVILTTDANQSMIEVHNRMPVVLRPDERNQWVESYQSALDILQTDRPMLVKRPA